MKLAVAASLLLIVLLASVGPVSAHAEVVKSDPADGAVLAAAPATVQIWFSEELDTKASTATVVDAAGAKVDAGARVSLETADHQLLVVALKPSLGAGTFTVKWHSVTADDAGVVEGSFKFQVTAAGAPPAAQPPAAPATGKLPATGRGLGVVAVAGAALLVVGTGLALGRRKR